MTRRTGLGLLVVIAAGLITGVTAWAHGGPGDRAGIMKRVATAVIDAALDQADEGEGIPPEERERGLTPFYRRGKARTAAAPDAPSTGFGLGLTVVRRIAEVHGGTLTIGPSTTLADGERGRRVTLALPAGPSP